MSQLADLVGAIRLPTGAHRRTAGTDARHRPAGPPPPRPDGRAAPRPGWESTRAVDDRRASRSGSTPAWPTGPRRSSASSPSGTACTARDTLRVRPDVRARRGSPSAAARRAAGGSSPSARAPRPDGDRARRVARRPAAVGDEPAALDAAGGPVGRAHRRPRGRHVRGRRAGRAGAPVEVPATHRRGAAGAARAA